MTRLYAVLLLLVTSNTVWCADVVVLTHSAAIAATLRSHVQVVSTDTSGGGPHWYRGDLSTPRYDKPYRLAIGQITRGSEDTNTLVEHILERFTPRYIVLLDEAVGIGNKVAAGDVAVARLLWEYRLEADDITPLRDEQYRGNGALINASLALNNGWADSGPGRGRPPKLVAAAVASGPGGTGRNTALETAILKHNPRTIATTDTAAAAITRSVRSAKETGHIIGYALFVAITSRDTLAAGHAIEPQPEPAASNSVSFLIAMLKASWPAPPK
jgi:hypothetical protein